MMPRISFFKIRLVALIIGFLIMFFLVGLVKSAFADQYRPCEDLTSFTVLNSSTYVFERQVQADGQNLLVTSYYATMNSTAYYGNAGHITYQAWGTQCKVVRNTSTANYATQQGLPSCSSYPAAGEIVDCPGDYEPPVEPPDDSACQESGIGETYSEALGRCAFAEKELTYYDTTNCRGVCGCSEEQYKSAISKCVPYSMKYYSEATCEGMCGNCDDLRAKREAECTALGGVLTDWACDDQGNIYSVCDDGSTGTPITTPGTPEPTPTPSTPPITPTPTPTENPDDPSDAKLAAINDNLKKILESENTRTEQVDEANDNLEWIGKNADTIADNTKIIGDRINTLSNDIKSLGNNIGSGTDMTETNNKLGSIDQTLSDIADGDYIHPTEPDKFEAGEHDWGFRTTQFFDEMKNTGLFSLAESISSSVPGGGTSSLTINGGETFGNHTIDFANYSSGLNAVGAALQIAGMLIGIRIITLKR